jgi:hypothetical protein
MRTPQNFTSICHKKNTNPMHKGNVSNDNNMMGNSIENGEGLDPGV